MEGEGLLEEAPKALRTPIFSPREIAVAVVLGALSMFFVFAPDLRLPWGMAALDFIAVPWIVAFMLLGLKGGLLTSTIGFLSIFFFSEETVPFIGAIMKFSATIPLIMVPALILRFAGPKYSGEKLGERRVYISVMAAAIAVRCLVTIFLNYYVAIPLLYQIGFGIPLKPSDVPASFNWFFWGEDSAQAMSPNPLVYYLLGVSLWNTWQGIIDSALSWLIVYPTKLYKQYGFW